MVPVPIIGHPKPTIFQRVDDECLFATGVAANEYLSVGVGN
jgi:hypothetical protein